MRREARELVVVERISTVRLREHGQRGLVRLRVHAQHALPREQPSAGDWFAPLSRPWYRLNARGVDEWTAVWSIAERRRLFKNSTRARAAGGAISQQPR